MNTSLHRTLRPPSATPRSSLALLLVLALSARAGAADYETVLALNEGQMYAEAYQLHDTDKGVNLSIEYRLRDNVLWEQPVERGTAAGACESVGTDTAPEAGA